jgi:hypothetical protein
VNFAIYIHLMFYLKKAGNVSPRLTHAFNACCLRIRRNFILSEFKRQTMELITFAQKISEPS